MALNIPLYIFYFHRVLNYKGVLTFGGRVPGNGDFTSILAFGSEPAALRNPQKKAIPDFTSILAFSSEPAALRNPQKKAIPQKTACIQFFEHVFPTFAVHYFFPADPFERGFKIASKCHLILDFDYSRQCYPSVNLTWVSPAAPGWPVLHEEDPSSTTTYPRPFIRDHYPRP